MYEKIMSTIEMTIVIAAPIDWYWFSIVSF